MVEKEKKIKIKCPTCKKQTEWHNNPHRPFCSERCRLVDLGRWADESYSIEGSYPPDFEEET
ncbi:DNA gyrase inhibitor YacG [bacterium]|nr:DNA gyrase inhibitor YacG [bacterium]